MFEKSWIDQEGFIDLIYSWWTSYTLSNYLGNSWKFKLQFLRQKLRGWNANLQGHKRRQKHELLDKLTHYESLHDSNSLTPSDHADWQECQTSLYKIYKDEEYHWQ